MNAEYLREQVNYDPDTGLFRWKRPKQGRTVGRVTGQFDGRYVMIKIDGKKYYAHRLAWLYTHGAWPSGQIDHMNEVKIDNRIENLIDATKSHNMINQSKPSRANKSGIRGVSQRRGKFRATFRGRHLGDFITAELAGQTYEKAKEEALS